MRVSLTAFPEDICILEVRHFIFLTESLTHLCKDEWLFIDMDGIWLYGPHPISRNQKYCMRHKGLCSPTQPEEQDIILLWTNVFMTDINNKKIPPLTFLPFFLSFSFLFFSSYFCKKIKRTQLTLYGYLLQLRSLMHDRDPCFYLCNKLFPLKFALQGL